MHEFTLPPKHTGLSHKLESNAQLERLNESGGIPVELAVLAGRPVHIEFQGCRANSLSVWTTSSESGFRSIRREDSDLHTVRFVDHGVMLRGDRGGAISLVGSREVIFTSFDAMHHEEAGPEFSSINATVNRNDFAKACMELEIKYEHVSEVSMIRPSSMLALQSLRQSLLYLSTNHSYDLQNSDMMTPLIQKLLIYQMVSAYSPSGYECSTKRSDETNSSLKRAVDYIESNINHSINLSDIAAAAGIGVRRLQIVFKNMFGYGPAQYIISRRLDLVYSSLLNREGKGVGDIAMRWGFVHMSDFSHRFKDRFGVSPKAVNTKR